MYIQPFIVPVFWPLSTLRCLHPPLASSYVAFVLRCLLPTVAFESLRQRWGMPEALVDWVPEALIDWVPEALEGTLFSAK